MRIGIITFLSTKDNYGQILQAYALQDYLKRRGHDARHIIYGQGRNNLKEHLRSLLINPFGLTIKVFKRLFRYNIASKVKEFTKNNPRYFDEFKKQHILTYENVYIGPGSINASHPYADAYITGSDQVWGGFDWRDDASPFYLDFAPRESIKLAYAASFGTDDISERKRQELRARLKIFKGLSLREQSGVELCKSIGYPNAIQVIDPTMLLTCSQYLELLDGQHLDKWEAKRKVFCYLLNFQTGEEIYWNQIKELFEEDGSNVRMVISSGCIPAYDRIGFTGYYSPDIYNWIYSIKMADYVITNSFHGLVFSILFHKRFSVVLLKGNMAIMNTRVISLLQDFGLSKRILTEDSLQSAMAEDIDWSIADKVLKEKRKEADSFLSQCGI